MKIFAQACLLALGVSAIKFDIVDDESMAQVDAFGYSAYDNSAYGGSAYDNSAYGNSADYTATCGGEPPRPKDPCLNEEAYHYQATTNTQCNDTWRTWDNWCGCVGWGPTCAAVEADMETVLYGGDGSSAYGYSSYA